MAIQTGPGELRVDVDDPTFTTHGVTWAIKCRQALADWRSVYVLVKSPNGSWLVNNIPEAVLISDFDQDMRDKGGSVKKVFEEVLLVRLNTWLSKQFVAGQAPPVVEDEVFAQLFGMTKTIKITAKADGTVVASLV